MTISDYLEQIPRPTVPADPPTWRLGTDHIILRIPEDTLDALGYDTRYAEPVLEEARDAFLGWWFADANLQRYGWRLIPQQNANHAQHLALGELERMLGTLTWQDPIHAARSVQSLSDPCIDDPPTGLVLVLDWVDVLGWMWLHLHTPTGWAYGREPAPTYPPGTTILNF
jgi:hypothetical protein